MQLIPELGTMTNSDAYAKAAQLTTLQAHFDIHRDKSDPWSSLQPYSQQGPDV